MKNKGIIKFLLAALTLVTLFHLSFTWVAHRVEQTAEEAAGSDPALKRHYLDSIAFEPVYDIGIADYTYQEVKERQLNLGLDLQGGMHVTMEVDVENLLRRLSNNNPDSTFQRALALAREDMKHSTQDYLSLFYRRFKALDPEARLAPIFATRENRDYISYKSTDEEVLNFLRREIDEAVRRTYNILLTRIDRFGVAQPNIQLLEGSNRIMMDLPGVDDPNRVRRLLQRTAQLEFWETYEAKDIIPLFEKVNQVLAARLHPETAKDTASEASAAEDTTTAAATDTAADLLAELGIEEGGREADTDTGMTAPEQLTPEEAARRYPLYQVLYPAIQQTEQGTFAQQGPVVGYAAVKDTAKVNAYLALPEVQRILPRDVRFAWTAKPVDAEGKVFALLALKASTREGGPALTGDVVTDARVSVTPTGEREVLLQMNPEGAERWRQITRKNVGRSVAIVLDRQVYSYPVVQTEISGGSSSITGGFTMEEAQDLANLLKSGKLPVRVAIVEEAVVGPTLGAEAIRQGMISLIIGFVLVMLLMVLYYNTAGVFSVVALLANLVFIIGILASLGASLTLPGIAGLVLTVGMAVDANVIIYERIREELRAGKGLKLAIADGYRHAYSAIIDANVTTLIVGIVLAVFGTGPIQGFATVLIIGILTSLFTSIFITRLLMDWWLAKGKTVKFSYPWNANMLVNADFPFIKWRKKAYLISGVVILAGVVSFFTQGFKLGVDFKGGYSFVVKLDKDVPTHQIAAELAKVFDEKPAVTTFDRNDQVRVTTSYMLDSDAPDAQQQVQALILKTLKDQWQVSGEVLSSQKVGPTIAEDIKAAATWAVIVSLLLVFIYIFIRFQRWQFGVGAIIALAHDVLIILSVFSLLKNLPWFSLDVDQAFIAAVLTIVGYSINDTVVVFDRIRERLQIRRRLTFLDSVNRALNETLSRTVITSLTTFVVVLVLFLFGGETIRNFSFALLIGIIAGTYSSLFIAAPIMVDLSGQKKSEEAA